MDSLSYIKQPIAKDLVRFNELFDECLNSSDAYLKEIFAAIRQRRGKLMRPILFFLVAKELGKISHCSYLSAITLEVLHTASLIHDDVVDESNERRGHASINALYGNQIAVLSGDYLLSVSLMKAADTQNINIVNRISLLGKQLSGGEIIQLKNASTEGFSESSYFNVIKLKTAALFAASAELAAISVGAKESVVSQMKELGETIGICFQIRDDIFDYYNDSAVGKPTGNDLLEGKMTLPLIYALEHTDDLEMKALALKVKNEGVSKEEIDKLVAFSKAKGGIAYAEKQMQNFANKAKKIVANFQNANIRASMLAYIDFVTDRTL